MAETKDIVCGMTVDTDDAVSTEHEGKTYYFCSDADLESFMEDPEKFIEAAA
ncbi:MAG: YHS domain-containing protein [Dehalococcoidia bacterium]